MTYQVETKNQSTGEGTSGIGTSRTPKLLLSPNI